MKSYYHLGMENYIFPKRAEQTPELDAREDDFIAENEDYFLGRD